MYESIYIFYNVWQHIPQLLQADGWMPQDLSNFLWSSAALRCDLPLPLELIAQRAAQLTWQQFKPQDAQGTHWGTQP